MKISEPCAAVLVRVGETCREEPQLARRAVLREISCAWRRRMPSSARSTAHLEVYRLRKNSLLICSRSLKWSVSESGGSCRLTRVCGVSIGVCSTAPTSRTALTLIITTPRAANRSYDHPRCTDWHDRLHPFTAI